MKWVLVTITAIVLVTVAAMAAMPWLVDTPRVQSLIASSVTHALARPVKFRSASVALMPYPAVRLRGVEIAEDPAVGAGPFVRLDDADFRVKLAPLLRGHLEFTTLVLKRPTITLAHGPAGRWNFASLGAPREGVTGPRPPRAGGGGGPSLLATRVIIDKGIVVYEGRGKGSLTAGQRLEDVDATLSRRAGTLSLSGSGRLVPAALRVKVADGTIALGGARTFTEASLRARVEIDGEDVHPLAAAILGGDEPAIGGSLRGRLDVSGTLGRPRAAGEVEWRVPTVTRTSRACGEPRRRTLALASVKASVSWRDGRLIADPLTTGIPGGTATSTLTTETSPPARADLTGLALQRIPLERVLVDFLCQPYAVAGPLDLTGTLTLSPGDPLRTLSGRGRLHVGAGRVVGARALALFGGLARAGGASPARGSDLPATLAAAPFEFDAIDGAFEIGNGVVTTRDLVYTSRLLTVRARGTYALANDHLNADLVLEHERGTFQAKVTGSAEAPSIRTPQSFARHDADRADRGFKDLLKKFR